MEKLVSVIGKAPSEMTDEELQLLVERESRRMYSVLSRGAKPKPAKKAKGKKAKPKKSSTMVSRARLKEIARLTGVPLEDLIK